MRFVLSFLILFFMSPAFASVTVQVNGSNHTIPQTNEKGWGTNVTAWIQAISLYTLQPSGGTFTMNAETDFGATYGFKVPYIKTATAVPATAGVLRLAVSDVVDWRNNANGGNLALGVDASDNLTFQSSKLLLTGAVVNADINGSAAIAYSKLNLATSIVNADINGSAAIADSKLATISTALKVSNSATTATSANTNSAIVARDGSGNFTATTITAALTGVASGNTAYTANNHGVVISGSANTMTVIAPDASTSKVLTSGGSSADPTWASVPSAPISPREMFNLGLSNSVGSSNLTLALKQTDGSTDPSSGGSAVKVAMRSNTATSGALNERSITAALSLVITSGTTLGTVNSVAKNLWIYLIDSDGAGTMKLGASTFQYDEDDLQTTVAESFSATATNASPCVFTASAHGLINQNKIRITGTPPTGFSTGTDYYLVNKATNTFQLSATPGGTAINSSSTGSSIVIHIADPMLVSDAVYTSKPVRLIGRGVFTETTAGTWASAATTLTSGPGAIVPELMGARYTNTAGTSVANSGDTKIPWATKDYDSHGQLATDTFVAVVPGKYRITAKVDFQSSLYASGNIIFMTIYKNGAAFTYSPTELLQAAITNLIGSAVTATLNLAAGDYIDVRISNTRTAGATLLTTTAGENHLQIERIGL